MFILLVVIGRRLARGSFIGRLVVFVMRRNGVLVAESKNAITLEVTPVINFEAIHGQVVQYLKGELRHLWAALTHRQCPVCGPQAPSWMTHD